MPESAEFRRPVTFAAFLGAELRRYREAAGLSLNDLGKATNYTGALIGYIETGKRSCPRSLADTADELLDARGALRNLWAQADQEPRPGWPLVEIEAQATVIKEFQPQVIPSLVQTEEYATEVIQAGRPEATGEEIKHEVAARMGRQAVLERDKPPWYWVILDEAVLRRVVGDPATMVDALTAVLDAAARPRVTVQALPFDAGAHPALDGPLIVLETRDKTVLREGRTTGRVITEPDDLAECAHAFDILQSNALNIGASLDLIRAARDGHRTGRPADPR